MLWPGISIEVLPQLNSTNSELMERARQGQLFPTVLVAERQTAGRGRMGKVWQSQQQAGASLTFSIGLPWQSPHLSGLSLVVGYSIAQALDPLQHMGLQLKWPNDIWVNRHKLGGILIELCSQGQHKYVVIGIGINIMQPPALPSDANRHAMPPTWLQAHLPHITAGMALQQIVPTVLQQLQEFAQLGFAPWQEQFATRDALLHQPVWLTNGMQGVAQGVSATGALQILTPQGTLQEVISDEVSVRPIQP